MLLLMHSFGCTQKYHLLVFEIAPLAYCIKVLLSKRSK